MSQKTAPLKEELNVRNRPKRLRVFQRAEIPGSVYIHDDKHLFIAPLTNISAGGVFVSGLTSLPQGRGVRIVIKSPRFETAIQAKGTIVRVERSHRNGLAVEFTSISSKARDSIQNSVFESRMEGDLLSQGKPGDVRY